MMRGKRWSASLVFQRLDPPALVLNNPALALDHPALVFDDAEELLDSLLEAVDGGKRSASRSALQPTGMSLLRLLALDCGVLYLLKCILPLGISPDVREDRVSPWDVLGTGEEVELSGRRV